MRTGNGADPTDYPTPCSDRYRTHGVCCRGDDLSVGRLQHRISVARIDSRESFSIGSAVRPRHRHSRRNANRIVIGCPESAAASQQAARAGSTPRGLPYFDTALECFRFDPSGGEPIGRKASLTVRVPFPIFLALVSLIGCSRPVWDWQRSGRYFSRLCSFLHHCFCSGSVHGQPGFGRLALNI